jgi:chemosensory pili system protein ChpA (sensor histidine kinase/response regulator)
MVIRRLDREVLENFVKEARGYLPQILRGIHAFSADPRSETLEEAHRYSHSIKGASSMVGLSELSEIAHRLEQELEDAAGSMGISPERTAELRRLTEQIEDYLARLQSAEPGWAMPELGGSPGRRGSSEGPSDTVAPEQARSASADPALAEAETGPIEGVAAELLEIFGIEAEDHLRHISDHLASLEKEPGDRAALQEIRRATHTLKGAAGSVGFTSVARLAHRMEDLLDRLSEGRISLDRGVLDLVFASSDALHDLALGQVEESAIDATLEGLYQRYSIALAGVREPEGPDHAASPSGEDELSVVSAAPAAPSVPPEPAASAPQPAGKIVRVPLDRLDQLARLLGELVIGRTALEQRMVDFLRQIGELRLSAERLQRASAQMETRFAVMALGGLGSGSAYRGDGVARPSAYGFDSLEFDRYTEVHLLARELAETSSDIRTTGSDLAALHGDLGGLLNRQAGVSRDLQDVLMRTRMVPLATVSTRLHRTVRNVAGDQGKQADLLLAGGDTELDTTVLDAMVDPLVHLLRNAVDHGIEPPELRRVLGKPEHGAIRLEASHEGNEIVLRISDDGAGLSPSIIRAAAVKGGFLEEAQADQISERGLSRLIFLPGFTTAPRVSEVSGRGMGLDIVQSNVHKLNGTVSVESQLGRGTTFTIRLPITLAVIRALLVQANQETFAVPMSAVNRVHRIAQDDTALVGRDPVLRLADQVYPLYRLGEALKLRRPAEEGGPRLPALILSAGASQIALLVDRILGAREIVVKPLGSHLRRVRGLIGATLLGDGSVVLILNPADLLGIGPRREPLAAPPLRAAGPEDGVWTIMAVDDSLSVRRVLANLIRAAGWRPITAKDGVEALEILQRMQDRPDLILVDLEMPRMDGYELMSRLKGLEGLREIPLVVVTSRTAEKHRRKALELGASDYIVKPYQDNALLAAIHRLVREARGILSA